MENLTDQQLITLHNEGNPKAIDGLIFRHSQNVYRFSLKLLGNSDEAKDITQETFIKVWKNIKKFDHSKNFKTWLFTIAQRTAIDYLRKRKNVNFSSLDNTETDTSFEETIPDLEILADEIFEKNENVKLVQTALKGIPIDMQTILVLHNGEEMTFEEIAEVVNKPMNTVKSQYRRALINLKKVLNEVNAPN